MAMVHIRSTGEKARRRVETALVDPHGASERFDPEFVLSFQCSRCNQIDCAPRRDLRAAFQAHLTEDCPMRHVDADAPVQLRVFYPKAK